MKIQKMIDIIKTSTPRVMDENMIIGMMMYIGSVSMAQWGYRKNIKYRNKTSCLYFIGFANSGFGKSFLMRYISEIMFNEKEYMRRFHLEDKIFRDRFAIELNEELERATPIHYTISLNGTVAGLEQTMARIKKAGSFPVNIEADEFINTLTGEGKGVPESLIEFFDGKALPANIKGKEGSRILEPLFNLPINFMAVSTKQGKGKEKREIIKNLLTGGIFRRAIIVDSDLFPEEIEDFDDSKIPLLVKHFVDIDKKHVEKFRKLVGKPDFDFTQEFKFENDAIDELNKIASELLDNASKDRLDIFKQYDTGAIELITTMTMITAYIEGDMSANRGHAITAYSLFKRTRKSAETVLHDPFPHDHIYNMLLIKSKPMTHAELLMLDIEGIIPQAKNAFSDSINLVEEKCYYTFKELVKTKVGNIERYMIQDLQETNLERLIISVPTGKTFETSNVSWKAFPKILKSDKLAEFCSIGFTGKKTRTASNIKKGQNIIVFSFYEEDISVELMQKKLKTYKYLIYKIDIDGFFNVVIPTRNHYYVDEENYREFIENICKELTIETHQIDPKTQFYNWKTSSGAVIVGRSEDLIDITCCLPNIITDNNIEEDEL